jgi:hypothetical protein
MTLEGQREKRTREDESYSKYRKRRNRLDGTGRIEAVKEVNF